jgi:hypothetical protein
MERMMKKMESYNIDDDFYIHFDSIEKCNDFIIHVNNKGYSVYGRCCSDKGCRFIDKKISNDIKKLQENFLLKRKVHHKQKTTIGTCDICFNDNLNLFGMCSVCPKEYCKPCLDKMQKCPTCRTVYKRLT